MSSAPVPSPGTGVLMDDELLGRRWFAALASVVVQPSPTAPPPGTSGSCLRSIHGWRVGQLERTFGYLDGEVGALASAMATCHLDVLAGVACSGTRSQRSVTPASSARRRGQSPTPGCATRQTVARCLPSRGRSSCRSPDLRLASNTPRLVRWADIESATTYPRFDSVAVRSRRWAR